MLQWGNLAKRKDLIYQLVKREIAIKYKGSFLGFLWNFLTPILMLCVYTFVFSVVFKAKWNTGAGIENDQNHLEFALILFCGISTYNIFSEVVGRSPTIILNNENLVKKVVFPLEIFPFVLIGASFIQFIINFVILLLGIFFTFGSIQLTTLYVPLVLFPLTLITLGISWFLSSLGVYLRDINHIIGIFLQALMFLSPIFYPITNIPEEMRFLYTYNPISYVVEDMRNVVIWGKSPNWSWLLIGTCISIIVFLLGFTWFRKTRKGFSDVI